MSVEENKAVSRRFGEELFNKHNIAILDEILAPDYVDHTAALLGAAPDREGTKQMFAMQLPAFPDFRWTLEDIIAEGDKVVMRFTARGTQTGAFMGIPPTGKQVTMTGIAIHRIAGGRIAENWVQIDMLGLMQQLGVIPTPGEASR